MIFGKQSNDTLNLALQGGGAHGAFTWGVLEIGRASCRERV